MSDKKNTEIAVNEGFAALANRDVLNEDMADDCQGLEFSFDRVKLPAGGGTAFEMILSRLVDTFSSRILYPMLLLSGNHSIAVV